MVDKDLRGVVVVILNESEKRDVIGIISHICGLLGHVRIDENEESCMKREQKPN